MLAGHHDNRCKAKRDGQEVAALLVVLFVKDLLFGFVRGGIEIYVGIE